MKEVKLVRLLTKNSNGEFNPSGLSQEVRTRIKILEKVFTESQETCKQSGLLYLEIEPLDENPKLGRKSNEK